MVTLIVCHDLDPPTNAIENYLIFRLTFYLVAESGDLALCLCFSQSGVLSKKETGTREISESKISKGSRSSSLCVVD